MPVDYNVSLNLTYNSKISIQKRIQSYSTLIINARQTNRQMSNDSDYLNEFGPTKLTICPAVKAADRTPHLGTNDNAWVANWHQRSGIRTGSGVTQC